MEGRTIELINKLQLKNRAPLRLCKIKYCHIKILLIIRYVVKEHLQADLKKKQKLIAANLISES